jgi:hypothetical protein
MLHPISHTLKIMLYITGGFLRVFSLLLSLFQVSLGEHKAVNRFVAGDCSLLKTEEDDSGCCVLAVRCYIF